MDKVTLLMQMTPLLRWRHVCDFRSLAAWRWEHQYRSDSDFYFFV